MNQPIKRTDNTSVPDSEELRIVLETEITRPLPPEKVDVHYPEFGTVIKIFDHFGVSSELFTDDAFDIFKVVDTSIPLLSELVGNILSKELNKQEIELFDNAYDYLTEEDIPEKSDVIIVFGSKTPFRPEKAAEIYKKGLCRKILVSGSRPIYETNTGRSEAEKYYEILVDNGVSDSDILIEDEAISVIDNVRRSLNMLDRLEFDYKKIILVNSPYTQRRGYVNFLKASPDDVTFFRVNSGCSEPYRKENWYKQENTLKVIINEFIKMRACVVYNSA